MTTPKVRPADRPEAATVAVRTDVDVRAEFPAERVFVTVAVAFSADLRSLAPDDAPAGFWGRYWDGLPDRLETALGDALRAGLGTSFEEAREVARQVLAGRFAEVTRTAA